MKDGNEMVEKNSINSKSQQILTVLQKHILNFTLPHLALDEYLTRFYPITSVIDESFKYG